MTEIFLPSVKAFGDLVIAISALQRIGSRQNGSSPKIVASKHLYDLASALGAARDIHFLGDDTWRDVPAAFDVAKRGKVAAVRSLLELRWGLGRLGKATLLFDRLGWREHFIGGRHNLIGLSNSCENIYSAYEHKFFSLGYESFTTELAKQVRFAPRAIIIPGSRITRKTIPANVISSLISILTDYGIQGTVIVLDGENFELPINARLAALPRNFDALVSTVRSSDIVISADSLSAHLGDYYGVPTFVATPTPNQYWLPPSCFINKNWALFSDIGKENCPFFKFLSSI